MTATLQVGSHLLVGKRRKLPRQIAVLDNGGEADEEEEEEEADLRMVGLISFAYQFRERPQPILQSRPARKRRKTAGSSGEKTVS